MTYTEQFSVIFIYMCVVLQNQEQLYFEVYLV